MFPVQLGVYAGLSVVLFLLVHISRPVFTSNRKTQVFWASIPIVGRDRGWLSWPKALLSSIFNLSGKAKEGYLKFSKHGIPFALTSTGTGTIVILPPSHMEILNMSHNHVNAFDAQIEAFQPRYMIGEKDVYMNMIQHDVVRQKLTKDSDFFSESLAEEFELAMKDYLGNGKEWKTVNMWDLCGKLISRAAIRAYVGAPLCRDERLLETIRLYIISVCGGASLITAMPMLLRPLLGHLVALPAKRLRTQCIRGLIPEIKKRLLLLKTNDNLPNDILQWLVERCAKAGPSQMSPNTIAERMLVLILSSVYGTVYTFTNCVLDIYSNNTRDECVNGLRDEINSVVSRYGGLNTSQAINRLFRVDSVLRESMRLSCFAIIGLQRIVASREGLEIDQARAPFGSRLGIPIQAIHHDKDYYENPLTFDAFRFSRPFEGVHDEEKCQERELSASVTKSFLSFGYGKHTCPGRWFAVQLMKQGLTLLIQNYDIECIATSPPKKSLAHLVLPPNNSPVRIRRRF